MSTLVENVAKVTAAHAALKEAIAAKGVTVPEGTTLSEMPALIKKIWAGVSPAPTSSRAVFADDVAESIVVPEVMVINTTAMTNLAQCFYGCAALTSLTLPEGFGSNATNLYNCFRDCTSLTYLTLPDGFGQNATRLDQCFGDCHSLTSIVLPDGFGKSATTLSHCFDGCSALITITGNPSFKVSLDLASCTNLTRDSLMVVINGLQIVTTTQTLTLGSANLAKLTDDEKKVATDKGWTLA